MTSNTLGSFTKLDTGAFTGTCKPSTSTRRSPSCRSTRCPRMRPITRVLCRTRDNATRPAPAGAKSREIERRDLRQSQDRGTRIRAVRDLLPAREARAAGRRRRHPHDPVGTARGPVTTIAPSRVTAAGLFHSRLNPVAGYRAPAPVSIRGLCSRRISQPTGSNRTASKDARCPQFCRAQGARLRAPVILHARQNRLPRAPLRGAPGGRP